MKVSRVLKHTIDILLISSALVTVFSMNMCVYTVLSTKLAEASNWVQIMYTYSSLMIAGLILSFYLRRGRLAVKAVLPTVIVLLLVTKFNRSAYNEISHIVQDCESFKDFVRAIKSTYVF